MENAIIICIILFAVVIALLRVKKHFKGGCCGSGSTVRSKKKLTEPKLGEKVLEIEGMHCENCQNRIETALNRLDGVVCKVNLKKKTATVSYSTEVSDEKLTQIVEELGFQVRGIRN